MNNFYKKSIEETFENLGSSEVGLTTEIVEEKIKTQGKNVLIGEKKKSLIARFFSQFKDMMIIVLLVAAVISAVLAIVEKQYVDLIDSGLILLIVIVNAIIGVIQEAKADSALEMLKNISKPYAKVLRNGEVVKIKSEDIVVGDIVVLEAGDVVPADLRLIQSASLKIEESSLTGESVATEKDATEMFEADTPLAERKNMAYSSTVVTYGRGKGIVTAIGMNTEVGKIAKMLSQNNNTKTPLQKQLDKTAKILSLIVVAIAVIMFVFSLITKGFGIHVIIDNFMLAVAVAVAAIPEGLPTVVTIVLSIGVSQMSKRKAIVKNLPAVETLGCCEVICSDKTGTLTLNKMTVKSLFTPQKNIFNLDKEVKDIDSQELLNCMLLCNDTTFGENGLLVGDPTETALTSYGLNLDINVNEFISKNERIDEVPFDSDRKLMTTVNNISDKKVAYTKGAVDMLVKRCSKILDGSTVRDITEKDIENIYTNNTEMASKALRVLAFAKSEKNLEHDNLEKDLVFIGLVGMIDPPREETKHAVEICSKAGIKAVMITGDHLDTAKAIASEIGILKDGDLCITGAELDKLTDEEFIANLFKYSVYARVSPENKVRIVKAFKSLNKVVAMTGDGVNDAPSIKAADIGVGMGITGTDVSKNAADIVLTDDNFATIVSAVEEGRKIYSNIKKSIQYLLSANIVEVACIFIATIILKLPFLSAVMILWINLVTDSLPSLALGMEKAEKNIMEEKPRKSGRSLFSGETGINIITQGFIQTVLTMTAFCIGAYVIKDATIATTMAFITLSFIQLFHAYNNKSQHASLFSKNPFDNKLLNISFLVGIIMILFVTLVPFMQTFFGTTSMPWYAWLISVGLSISIIPLVEIQKFIVRLIIKRKNKKLNKTNI